jgi:heptosyltransferase I
MIAGASGPGSAAARIEVPEEARICIVLLTGLGDVVHGLPVASALKRHRPDSRITWVVEPMPAPVVQDHPAVDEVVVFHKKEGTRGVRALYRELKGRGFDLTLNLNIYFKSIWPTVFSGAPVRLGFDRGRARDLTWLFATHHLPARPRAHTQDMFLEFLEVLGVPAEPLEWRLGPTPAERSAQRRFFERFQRPVATIVPASANEKKDWIPERWAEVIDGLERNHGFDTLIVGGPSARERRIVDAVLDAAEAAPTVALGDGIRPLLWRIDGSALVLAPDTGPLHIARALDVPVIGLYGHTNPWRVGPYRAYQDLWVDAYTDPDEGPDPSNFQPKRDRMERITAGDVLDRVAVAEERYLPRARRQRGGDRVEGGPSATGREPAAGREPEGAR